jgi:hypothetical protein
MTRFDSLKEEIQELYALAMVQRSLRLGLRAFWLGIAGMLAAWGVNALWGWLPHSITWVIVGFGFALLPLAAVLVSLTNFSPDRAWVWKLDRAMRLREQLSTAWEVAEKHPRGMLNHLLVQETLNLLPKARRVVLKDGWVRRMDGIATVVMLLLTFLLAASFLSRPAPLETGDLPSVPQTAPQEPAAPAPQEPAPAQPQPVQSDAPGNEGTGQEGQGDGETDSAGEQPGRPSPEDAPAELDGDLAEALRRLGQELSRQAGTYELGQALENQDFAGAAGALEDLQDRLDDLSPESRENLEQALQEGAEAVDQAGEQSLADNMREAADALARETGGENEALDQMADDLRRLAEQAPPSQAAGAGAGEGGGTATGNPEPLERLDGAGGDFSLPVEDLSEPGLLSPAPPGPVGEATVGGALDSTGVAGDESIQSPLLPNTFQWKWRDVISQYFER